MLQRIPERTRLAEAVERVRSYLEPDTASAVKGWGGSFALGGEGRLRRRSRFEGAVHRVQRSAGRDAGDASTLGRGPSTGLPRPEEKLASTVELSDKGRLASTVYRLRTPRGGRASYDTQPPDFSTVAWRRTGAERGLVVTCQAERESLPKSKSRRSRSCARQAPRARAQSEAERDRKPNRKAIGSAPGDRSGRKEIRTCKLPPEVRVTRHRGQRDLHTLDACSPARFART